LSISTRIIDVAATEVAMLEPQQAFCGG